MRVLDFGQPESAPGGKPYSIPMAEILPGSHCVEIDRSPGQIACGQAVVEILHMPIVLILRRPHRGYASRMTMALFPSYESVSGSCHPSYTIVREHYLESINQVFIDRMLRVVISRHQLRSHCPLFSTRERATMTYHIGFV
jgi:hypothetical protein